VTVHLILPDPHAKRNTDNDRADLVGKLMYDLKPDVFINGGDLWDMESLSSYDKGKASFHNRRYKADIDSGLDFNDRLFHQIKKAKKKKPFSVFLEGNHEHRVKRMLSYSFELEGTVGFKDFDLNNYYDEVVEYEGATPGTVNVDGINYAHFFISGVKGLPISGVNAARTLLQKQHVSSTSFHLHTLDFSVETTGQNKKIFGLFAGVGHDRIEDFAGGASHIWWPGVIIKREVDDGYYEPEFVSFKRLKKIYG